MLRCTIKAVHILIYPLNTDWNDVFMGYKKIRRSSNWLRDNLEKAIGWKERLNASKILVTVILIIDTYHSPGYKWHYQNSNDYLFCWIKHRITKRWDYNLRNFSVQAIICKRHNRMKWGQCALTLLTPVKSGLPRISSLVFPCLRRLTPTIN